MAERKSVHGRRGTAVEIKKPPADDASSNRPVTTEPSRGDFHPEERIIFPPAPGLPPGRLTVKGLPDPVHMRPETRSRQALATILGLALGAHSPRGLGLRSLAALLAAGVALVLNSAFLSATAFGRFWEPLSARFTALPAILPLLITALFSGMSMGAVLAVIFRARTFRLSVCAALLAAALAGGSAFLGAMDLSSAEKLWHVTSAFMVPAGLLLGSVFTGVFLSEE